MFSGIGPKAPMITGGLNIPHSGKLNIEVSVLKLFNFFDLVWSLGTSTSMMMQSVWMLKSHKILMFFFLFINSTSYIGTNINGRPCYQGSTCIRFCISIPQVLIIWVTFSISMLHSLYLSQSTC